MRSVLAFTMRSKKQGALQNCGYKYARVLEYFHRGELSDEVTQRLKDGGGIDAIYAEFCRGVRPPEGGGDGQEEFVPESTLARTAKGTIDDETSDTPAVVVQGLHGECDCDDFHDDGVGLDRGRRKSVHCRPPRTTQPTR